MEDQVKNTESLTEENEKSNNMPHEATPEKSRRKKKTGIWISLGIVFVIIVGSLGSFFGIRNAEAKLLESVNNSISEQNWEAALQGCEDGLKLQPTQILVYQSKFEHQKAIATYKLGNYETAETLILAIMEKDPDFQEGNQYLAEIAYINGDLALAKSYAENAGKSASSSGLYDAIQSYEHYVNNQYLEAIESARSALSDNPDQALAHRVMGMTLYWQVEYDAAIEHLEEAIKLNPNDDESLAYLVLAQSTLYDFDARDAAFEKMEALNSDTPFGLMAKAILELDNFDPYKAFELIEQVYELQPDRHDFQFLYAFICPYQEYEQDHLEMLNNIYETNPSFVRAFLSKSLVEFSRFESEGRITDIAEKMSTLAPNSTHDEYLLFSYADRKYNFDEALEIITDLIEISPKDWTYYIDRADLFSQMNMDEEAKADYETAAEIRNEPLLLTIYEIDLNLKNKNYDLVLQQADTILAKYPNLLNVKGFKVFAYLLQEDYENAKITIDELKAIDPNNSGTLTLESKYFLAKGQSVEAMASINKAAEIRPEHTLFNYFRGYIYLSDGDFEHAYKEGQAIVSKNLSEAYGYELKARAKMSMGELEEAEKFLKEAVKINAFDAENYLILGETQDLLGKSEEAIENIDKSIAISDKEPRAFISRHYANISIGDTEAAKEDLNNALAFEDDLSLEDLDIVESGLRYLNSIPPFVDGIRHYVDDDLKFQVDYQGEWLPIQSQEAGSNSYTLYNGLSELRFGMNPPDDGSLMGLNPSLLLQYFRQELFDPTIYTFIEQESFNIDGRYWMADLYSVDPIYYDFGIDPELIDFENVEVFEKIYIFVDRNRYVAVDYTYIVVKNAADEDVEGDKTEQEVVGEIVRSFEFLH